MYSSLCIFLVRCWAKNIINKLWWKSNWYFVMHRNWKYGECENIFQIFGPVLPIIPVKNEDEAIEHIQNGWVCFLWYFVVVDKNLCKRRE